MIIRTTLGASCCLALAAGCTTRIPDIEHSQPAYSDHFPGHYQTRSACVLSEWDKSYHNNLQVIDANTKVAVLRGAWKGWGFELDPTLTTFTQVDDQTVLVEFRQRAERDNVPEWIVPGLRSEEHTSELHSLMRISYAVFCLKKKTHINKILTIMTVQSE